MRVRLDRFASLYIVSPLMRHTLGRQIRIPVLMYHGIADRDESGVGPYYRTITSPATFFAHMQFLNQNEYQACTLMQLSNLLDSSLPIGTKKVVITFDDGFLDFHRHAFPVLNQFGFTATMFLPTAFIGETSRRFKGQDCLTWSEVRELQRYGISFGSHTVTHPQLRTLGNEAIEREIADSKNAIEQKTGCTADSFAYPYAFPQVDVPFKRMLRDVLERNGYHHGVCTVVGRARCDSDRLFTERLPINDSDDEALFRAKLEGAYDWIGQVQSVSKSARVLGRKIQRN